MTTFLPHEFSGPPWCVACERHVSQATRTPIGSMCNRCIEAVEAEEPYELPA